MGLLILLAIWGAGFSGFLIDKDMHFMGVVVLLISLLMLGVPLKNLDDWGGFKTKETEQQSDP